MSCLIAGRYPNQAILQATLKAADEHHVTICRQQQVIHTVTRENSEKDTKLQIVIQEKDTQLQTVIQEKDTQLQRVIQVTPKSDVTVWMQSLHFYLLNFNL